MNQPIAISGAITGVLVTGLALLAIFLPGLTPETQAVIIAFGNSIILTAGLLYAKARSTSVANPTLIQGTDVTVVTPAGQPNYVATV